MGSLSISCIFFKSVLQHITPFKSLFGQKPDYHFLKVFGCAYFPFLKPYNKHKFAFKTSKCLFLGHSPFHKGYRCLHPSGRIYITRSVTFDERSFPYQSMFNLGPSLSTSQFTANYRAPSFVLPAMTSTPLSPTNSLMVSHTLPNSVFP